MHGILWLTGIPILCGHRCHVGLAIKFKPIKVGLLWALRLFNYGICFCRTQPSMWFPYHFQNPTVFAELCRLIFRNFFCVLLPMKFCDLWLKLFIKKPMKKWMGGNNSTTKVAEKVGGNCCDLLVWQVKLHLK